MYLQNGVKDYAIQFKRIGGQEPRPEKRITLDQANMFKSILGDRNKRFIDFHDENGNYIETINKGDISRIYRLSDSSLNDGKRYVHCGFGIKHEIKNGDFDCSCEKDFGILECQFSGCAIGEFGIIHPQDITPQKRNEIIKFLTKKSCKKDKL
jgi:hypothetical protein